MAERESTQPRPLLQGRICFFLVPVLGCLLGGVLGCAVSGVTLTHTPLEEALDPPGDGSPVAALALRSVRQDGHIGHIDPAFERGVSYQVMGSFTEDGRSYDAVCTDTEEPIWWFCLAIAADGSLKRGYSRFYLLAGREGVKLKTLYDNPSPALADGAGPLFRLIARGDPEAAEVTSVITSGPYAQAGDGAAVAGSQPDPDFSGCAADASGGAGFGAVLKAVMRVRAMKSQGVTYEVYVRSVAEAEADVLVAAMDLGPPCEPWLEHVGWIIEKYALAGKIWSEKVKRRPLEDEEFDGLARRHRELAPLRLHWEANAYPRLMDALWAQADQLVEKLPMTLRSPARTAD